MAGALLQMLPVLAGAPVPAVRLAGTLLQVLLASGAALLAWGFLGGGAAVLTAGALLASLGFLTLVLFAGVALGRARGAPRSVWAMRLALLALVVTFSLELLLTAALRGWVAIESLMALLATGVWRFARIAFALESKGSARPPQVVSRAYRIGSRDGSSAGRRMTT